MPNGVFSKMPRKRPSLCRRRSEATRSSVTSVMIAKWPERPPPAARSGAAEISTKRTSPQAQSNAASTERGIASANSGSSPSRLSGRTRSASAWPSSAMSEPPNHEMKRGLAKTMRCSRSSTMTPSVIVSTSRR